MKAAQAKQKGAKADTEEAKKALKAAAAALAEAQAEGEAAASERASLEAQLAAAQKSMAGEELLDLQAVRAQRISMRSACQCTRALPACLHVAQSGIPVCTQP